MLSYPLHFKPIENWILNDALFKKLLLAAAHLVEKVHQSVSCIAVDIHQVMSIADQYSHGDNAPEGLHQDGADYIVSALLVDRANIEGGVSRITNKQDKSRFLKHQLDIGEGIFQIDKRSKLWHDVSKIHYKPTVETEFDYGYRSTFGFDLNILRD